MTKLSLTSALALFCLVPALLPAQDATFTFFDAAFVPSAANVVAGDTVAFEWAAGTHFVMSGESSDPGDNPGEIFMGPVTESEPLLTVVLTVPGVYSFFDAENENGQVGTIIVEPFTTEVGVVNNSFTPQNVDIFVGDRVQWNWIEGVHTITSGSPTVDPGSVFDAPMTASQPVFIHEFSEVGLQNYFCIPHVIFSMDGTVLVQPLFIRGDVDSNDTIGLPDAINLLSYLFNQGATPSCLDAADTTDDGQLDLGDAISLLNTLFTNGPPLPAPYPTPGADRTADDLLCQ